MQKFIPTKIYANKVVLRKLFHSSRLFIPVNVHTDKIKNIEKAFLYDFVTYSYHNLINRVRKNLLGRNEATCTLITPALNWRYNAWKKCLKKRGCCNLLPKCAPCIPHISVFSVIPSYFGTSHFWISTKRIHSFDSLFIFHSKNKWLFLRI